MRHRSVFGRSIKRGGKFGWLVVFPAALFLLSGLLPPSIAGSFQQNATPQVNSRKLPSNPAQAVSNAGTERGQNNSNGAPIPVEPEPGSSEYSASACTTGVTDPASIPSPKSVYDFSGNPDLSTPTTFPGGTFSYPGGGEVRVVGTDWATWNPPSPGKHVFFTFSGTHTITFTDLQSGVGVVAEPNAFGVHPITIEAFNASSVSLGSFTVPIEGLAGASFLGITRCACDIKKVTLKNEDDPILPPGSKGFAYSDLTYGGTAKFVLADDTNGNCAVIQFCSTGTGSYCWKKAGGGSVSGPCTTTFLGSTTLNFQSTAGDPNLIQGGIDLVRRRGNGRLSVPRFSPNTIFTIVDSNIDNSTCTCP